MPLDFGFSGSWKVQSGGNWGRSISVPFPGDGARTVRVEPVTANRGETVQIMDIRLDKAFKFGKFGKLTAMFDAFNITNAGTVTTFRNATWADLQGSDRTARSAHSAFRHSLRLLVRRLERGNHGTRDGPDDPVDNFPSALRSGIVAALVASGAHRAKRGPMSTLIRWPECGAALSLSSLRSPAPRPSFTKWCGPAC